MFILSDGPAKLTGVVSLALYNPESYAKVAVGTLNEEIELNIPLLNENSTNHKFSVQAMVNGQLMSYRY